MSEQTNWPQTPQFAALMASPQFKENWKYIPMKWVEPWLAKLSEPWLAKLSEPWLAKLSEPWLEKLPEPLAVQSSQAWLGSLTEFIYRQLGAAQKNQLDSEGDLSFVPLVLAVTEQGCFYKSGDSFLAVGGSKVKYGGLDLSILAPKSTELQMKHDETKQDETRQVKVSASRISGSKCSFDWIDLLRRKASLGTLKILAQKNSKVERPLVIFTSCFNSKGETLFAPEIEVQMAEGSELAVLSICTEGSEALRLPEFKVSLAPNSKLSWVSQSLTQARSIIREKFTLQSDCELKFTSLLSGGALNRVESEFHLIGRGATLQTWGLTHGQGQSVLDQHTLIHHHQGHNTSSQLYKAILGGQSRTIFNGKVKVDPDSVQASSEQLHKSLALSLEAEINTKPELEIDHDDVRAKHGASVGQLSLSELFYLRSRGVSKDRAIMILRQAFASEIFERITPAPLRQVAELLWVKALNESSSDGENYDS